MTLMARGELIREGHMTGHFWEEVATELAPKYPREIARTILSQHGKKDDSNWFLEHSPVSGVLFKCIEADPKGCWEEFRPYLESPETAVLFTIGFPAGVIERMPREDVWDWISKDPGLRSALVARILTKDFSSDESMAAQLLGKYGDRDDVAASFFAAFTSGTWWGPSSDHWNNLAKKLEERAKATKLPGLQTWAANSARALRKMAEKDKKHEDERKLRDRS
jgi:hypothetical protein